ncbi:hypothetical protein KIPB_012046, partial [Kipferlia bialata]
VLHLCSATLHVSLPAPPRYNLIVSAEGPCDSDPVVSRAGTVQLFNRATVDDRLLGAKRRVVELIITKDETDSAYVVSGVRSRLREM